MSVNIILNLSKNPFDRANENDWIFARTFPREILECVQLKRLAKLLC